MVCRRCTESEANSKNLGDRLAARATPSKDQSEGLADVGSWLGQRSSRIIATRTADEQALQALGYSEIIAFLKGEKNSAQTIEEIAAHTRQFAKRQMTWFRGLKVCEFVPATTSFEQWLQKIVEHRGNFA